MKRIFRTSIRFGVLALVACSGLLGADPKPGANGAAASLDRLAWLAGNWRLEKEGRVIDEQWMSPAGGLMLGTSRTLAKGKANEFEFMFIREGPGGALFFVALPNGKNQTAFPMTSLDSGTVVFENPANDFPQKITYAQQPDGSLLASIEGPGRDGQMRRIDFAYRRVLPKPQA